RFGVLCSNIHREWVIAQSSTLETRISYSPADCFETFPQPGRLDDIGSVARGLGEHRGSLMLERSEGLTKTYNRVHDPNESSSDVEALRLLHAQLDHAVSRVF